MTGLPLGRGSAADAAAPDARAARLTFSGELTQGGWIRGKAPDDVKSLSLDGQPVPLAPDGAWFAAFDRDAPPQATLTVTTEDGTVTRQQLAVAPRDWNIEHVNIARRSGGPSEAFMKLRRPELARIHAARAMRTGAQGWRERFIWPVEGRISGRFGSQRIYRGEPGSYHSGIDITTGKSGTPFVAPADGVVTLVADKPFTLEGNLLMIDHGMGLNSAFLHCSQILVREGDHVKQGQVIGKIGMTGRATGPHLHWSIKWEDDRLDPLLFTGPMR
ncbi:peptidase [Novosphingobium malaysiense]|uniref:Peptidase n=1 Tax=Novosphingobium malaysiense TaxID=1348853 RepID=A0A0B1ZGV6_9SPHN|nr:peptidase [Novosphingobium malaysiense]